jgi:[ribosomal protein S5]-alanine N-acetyltransferase
MWDETRGMDGVSLRPIDEAELDQLARCATEPDAAGEFEWAGFTDPRTMRRRWEGDAWLGHHHARLAVESSGTLAGGVSHMDASPGPLTHAVYEIGIALLPEHRGHGVGTTAQRLLTRYLFDTTPAHRLQAYTETGNVREQRSLEKAGFTREGTLRASVFRAGTWRDTFLYALLR